MIICNMCHLGKFGVLAADRHSAASQGPCENCGVVRLCADCSCRKDAPDQIDLAALVDQFGRTNCDLCGERFKLTDEVAEMYDPDQAGGDPEITSDSHVCHAQCGLDKGLEIA